MSDTSKNGVPRNGDDVPEPETALADEESEAREEEAGFDPPSEEV